MDSSFFLGTLCIDIYISIYLYKYRYIKYIDISLPSLVVTNETIYGDFKQKKWHISH
jgi:hypothetical protein